MYKTKPKKLLFIIDNLSTGGAQRQMIHLAVGLKQRGHDIDVYCYTPGDLLAKPLYEAGVRVVYQLKNGRYSPEVVFNLRKLIRENGYDLAISFLTTPNLYAILSTRFAGRRIPVIVSERFCDLPQGISRTEKVVRQFYRYAAHVVVNSHHQRENFIRKYPWLKDRISTIYNGYDLNRFAPASTNPPGNHNLKLLTVSSVSPYKNGLILVEALRILRQEHGLAPTVDWIGQHIKEGEYGQYYKRMVEKIREYGLESQWNWMGQRTDVIEQMRQHDVLVHPSYGEGLPNVVCEALACARPVIVSNTLDHPRLIQDRDSGYVFNYQDPSELADRIREFNMLSPEIKRCMGERGRAYAEANLSNARFINSYEELINQILER